MRNSKRREIDIKARKNRQQKSDGEISVLMQKCRLEKDLLDGGLSRGIFGKRKRASIQLTQIHEEKEGNFTTTRDCLPQTHSLVHSNTRHTERRILTCSTRGNI